MRRRRQCPLSFPPSLCYGRDKKVPRGSVCPSNEKPVPLKCPAVASEYPGFFFLLLIMHALRGYDTGPQDESCALFAKLFFSTSGDIFRVQPARDQIPELGDSLQEVLLLLLLRCHHQGEAARSLLRGGLFLVRRGDGQPGGFGRK